VIDEANRVLGGNELDVRDGRERPASLATFHPLWALRQPDRPPGDGGPAAHSQEVNHEGVDATHIRPCYFSAISDAEPCRQS